MAAIAIATLAGVLCGLITGILHTFFGIPAILAGILTQMILWSANLIIMGKANVALTAVSDSKLISNLDTESLVSNLILLGFVVAVAGLLYWFFGTELGVSLRSTGSNPNMSRAQGINTDLAKVLGLMISNGLVALSGALLAQYSNAADLNMGKGAIVIGLAARSRRRGCCIEDLRQFHREAVRSRRRRGDLPHDISDGHPPRNEFRPAEGAVRSRRHHIPRHSLCET